MYSALNIWQVLSPSPMVKDSGKRPQSLPSLAIYFMLSVLYHDHRIFVTNLYHVVIQIYLTIVFILSIIFIIHTESNQLSYCQEILCCTIQSKYQKVTG